MVDPDALISSHCLSAQAVILRSVITIAGSRLIIGPALPAVGNTVRWLICLI